MSAAEELTLYEVARDGAGLLVGAPSRRSEATLPRRFAIDRDSLRAVEKRSRSRFPGTDGVYAEQESAMSEKTRTRESIVSAPSASFLMNEAPPAPFSSGLLYSTL